ncbi:hypothetical protein [Arthrobacter sp. USHLN218]|uniref:hypothetical protein n=1 Tax=Arthrobacter sp. USHLN218 TaxID=3081232 RepID=UPI003018549E
MNPNEKLHPEHADEPDTSGAGTDRTDEVHEGNIPVKGSEAKADELAKEAYGDKDADGEGDTPNVPFPG